MVSIVFPFRKEKSVIFREIARPVAKIFFWSRRWRKWEDVWMIVDTGADYTLLPNYLAWELGVDLTRDCEKFPTRGIGGEEIVYLYRKQKVKLGRWVDTVPVGFLARDDIPPLLGRQDFLEKFKVVFEKHQTIFS